MSMAIRQRARRIDRAAPNDGGDESIKFRTDGARLWFAPERAADAVEPSVSRWSTASPKSASPKVKLQVPQRGTRSTVTRADPNCCAFA
jgi:hypothetical protein